jgi:outer membrane protein assembly factor BamA
MRAKLLIYRIAVTVIGSLLTVAVVAQYGLEIQSIESDKPKAISDLKLRTSFKAKTEALQYVQQLPTFLQAKGYLSASVDTTVEKENSLIVHLFLGEQYQWKQLNTTETNWQLLEELGYKRNDMKISASSIALLPEKIINYYENNGYPFAKVKFDSVQLINNEISANLVIDKGILYRMDSIRVFGNAKISKAFLSRYLELPPGALYSRSALEKLDQKLLELNYVEQIQPWDISMLGSGYLINLYLKPKRTNQIDALIGFLPSNQQNNNKLLLTVDANVLLKNALAGAETIDFSWEQIQPKSPRLHLYFQQPYIFRSSFGLDLGFDFYKKDSSFLNINGRVGVQYAFSATQSGRIAIETFRTNLLDIDTNSIRFNKRLPDIIDVNVLNLSFQYDLNKTNYRFNPRSGYEFTITTTAGKKTIRKNNAITQLKESSFDYSKLYDSVKLNSYQFRFKANAAKYFPLAKQAVLKTSVTAGLVQSPNLFRNEMFQIGGYRLLRGFDEESIFSKQFAVATLEYRYLINLNSYFFGFTDLGYSQFKTDQTSLSNTYLGLGAGMAFETKQGIFNISYAVGKRNDLRFDFRQSKIHFGYVSFF